MFISFSILYKITISIIFTIIAVPPALINGSVRPVFGIIFRLTLKFTNICTIMSEIIQTHMVLICGSLI